MIRFLENLKKRLGLDEYATHIAGTRSVFDGFIWTKGFFFNNKGELYRYTAKVCNRVSQAGIDGGHIVRLFIEKSHCNSTGYYAESVALFENGKWSIKVRTKSRQRILRKLFRKLEKLPTPSKPMIVKVIEHLFARPYTKKRYRKRQKR